MAEARDPEKLRTKLIEFADRFPFFQLMGFKVLDCGPKHSKCQLTMRDELRNANGVLHGGVIATLIDASITQAMLMTDEYQVVRETKGTLTTIDLRVKYLRPATKGTLTCEANIVHLGKRVAHAQCVVRDEAGKEIALGDASLMITPGNA
ncbi:MAG TPA: PaaI family thioesterase [Polyangiales bacterium]|jgi:acyl-CoA thioesterase|nr:PaaI family thioesterase [Polyangiales bacterium]